MQKTFSHVLQQRITNKDFVAKRNLTRKNDKWKGKSCKRVFNSRNTERTPKHVRGGGCMYVYVFHLGVCVIGVCGRYMCVMGVCVSWWVLGMCGGHVWWVCV